MEESEKNEKPEPPEKSEKPVEENKLLSILKKINLGILIFFSALYIPILLLVWLNSLGWIPSSSLLFGFDFVPPILLSYLLIPVLLFSLLGKKWIYAGATLLVFLLFLLNIGDHSLFYENKNNPKKMETFQKTVSAVTLNTAQYDKGTEKIGGEVKSLDPDFIFLQEINFPIEEGKANTEKAFEGYNICIGEVNDSAILSKHPILEFHEVMLPSKQPGYVDNTPDNQANNINRYFLHAVADVDGTKINLLCLRMIAGRSPNFDVSPRDVFRWGRYLVLTQEIESKVMTDYMKKLNGPIIFAGDMNAPPNASSMNEFYRNWTDTALALHMIPHVTFPGKSPIQRLDYIFCDDNFMPLESFTSNNVISDHRVLYSKLALKR